jgi:hypothetical protein
MEPALCQFLKDVEGSCLLVAAICGQLHRTGRGIRSWRMQSTLNSRSKENAEEIQEKCFQVSDLILQLSAKVPVESQAIEPKHLEPPVCVQIDDILTV